MSKSRRGLLAAGLATAVVGATGVVWTLNASAAETPAPSTVAESASADAVAPVNEATAVPPKLLPWGDRPTELTQAEAGADSEEVADAGADAAPADTSGSLLPEAEYAPKGRISEDSTLRKGYTSVVPPAPPAAGKATAKAKAGAVYYLYAQGQQEGDTDGTWANLSIAKPELKQGDYHTLTEIAVQTTNGDHVVELGWNVDRTVNGDSDPHLFVFYWKDGVATCYNACGWTQYSSSMKPGDTLPAGVAKRMGIQHSDGNWWVAYDSEWIGYFPDSLWEGRFTRGEYTQWFGEVAANNQNPCTQMGNGLGPTSGTAARVGSISMTNGPEPKPALTNTTYRYNFKWLSDRTFRFGGPVDDPETDSDNC
ncbi:hypothetical protein GCM10010435_43150 [Winogradskya consettensis]|uniref:Neprosin PEP catalytic domain-containing protein n=1 Tax=Winogradskya consettensis TaxID=113560 RepID=A0A919T1H5_9ACTN|nr:neprosin family prolyl endopeptidase [Actinoplanes consettensis]GIM83477.1 hypothetical protein Aco04nite_86710 [Actinoplanes consettensis]